MKKNKIIILATEGKTSNICYHFLDKTFEVDSIIFERSVSRKTFLQRRIKKLGYVHVVGQILFQLIVPKILGIWSKKRIEDIMPEKQFMASPPPSQKTVYVNSVNDQTCIAMLQEKKPDLVIVNGTRIISKKVLSSLDCPFVNIHAGITPYYRGVHGGYWALANQDKERCGVTVHLVDKGIDTGSILKQANIQPTAHDNYNSYPYLQLKEGLQLLKECMPSLLDQTYTIVNSKEKGLLWHHPTLWSYLKNWIKYGVK